MSLIAFFPGQGAQQVGMLADIAEQFPQVEATYAEASDVLGFDLWKLVQEGAEEELSKTYNTQPALLAASTSIWRILKAEAEFAVEAAAGHSLGEYSALVAADAVDFIDAVQLVHKRGLLMEKAVPAGQGGMAAVLGLTDEAITEVCEEASKHALVEAVNFNAPGQVVIAGASAGVAKAIELAKAAGAKRAMPLAVSGPFHSSLMKPAADEFSIDVNAIGWRSPDFSVIHNATNESAQAEEIPSCLLKQLYGPVNWVGAVNAVKSQAVSGIEIGPGKVLSGLNKRIEKGLAMSATNNIAGLLSVIDTLNNKE